MDQVLFQVWILSFLFYQFDIVGTLSIDNLLMPMLVLAWPVVGNRKDPRVDRTRVRMAMFATTIFALLFIVDVAKLGGAGGIGVFWAPLIEHFKHYGYVLIPLLYISDEKSLKWSLTSILAITVMNCGIASLGAIGLAPPLSDTQETPRIPGLLRSRGPFANDGDTGLLIAFAGLLLWTQFRHRIRFAGTGAIVGVIALLVMFAGTVATQSRTVILSIATILIVYYWLRLMMHNASSGIRLLGSFLGAFAFLGAVILIMVNAQTIEVELIGMFGEHGEGTVRDRLLSYDYAIALLRTSPVFGLSNADVAGHSMFVTTLHNMWLAIALFSGVFGVLLVVAMITAGLIGALRLIRTSEWKEYGFVLASFILAPLWFSPNFYPAHNAFIFWFFVGMAMTSWQTYHFVRRKLSARQSATVGDVGQTPNSGNMGVTPLEAMGQRYSRKDHQLAYRRNRLKL